MHADLSSVDVQFNQDMKNFVISEEVVVCFFSVPELLHAGATVCSQLFDLNVHHSGIRMLWVWAVCIKHGNKVRLY